MEVHERVLQKLDAAFRVNLAERREWEDAVNQNDKLMVLGCLAASLGTLSMAGCCCKPEKSAKPILICNEDNDRFFYQADKWHTAEGMRTYFDSISKGGAMTHYFMCVNGQRPSYDSKVWEPIWLGAAEPNNQGRTNDAWCVNAKKCHDRGLDPWAIWIGCAREKGVSPWISMRMNDTHFSDKRPIYRNESRFYAPDRQILKCWPPKNLAWSPAGWNYAEPEVRKHALDLIDEILDRWDADGIELDWIRHPCHLRPATAREDAHFLTGFIREVRRRTELAAKRRGHPVGIAVRVPTSYEVSRALGLDAETWAREGLVDIVAPANFYATVDFDFDFDGWCRKIAAANPKVTVLPCACNMLRAYYGDGTTFQIDRDRAFLRAWTALYGGRGLYLFNFFYLDDETKQWVLSGGLSPDRVAEGPRRFPVFFHDIGAKGCDAAMQLPKPLSEPRTYRVRAVRSAADGRVTVRLGFDGPTAFPEVKLNGVPADGSARPVPNGGATFLPGNVKSAAEWTFPIAAFRDGANEVSVSAVPGAVRTAWCEIVLGE